MAPPISESTTWLVAVQNGQAGPFDLQQMREYWKVGKLTAHTYVWREGFENWVQVGQSAVDVQAFSAGQAAADGSQSAPSQQVAQTPHQAQPPAQQGQVQPADDPQKVDFGMDQDDDYLDGVFVDLVKNSWQRHRRRQLSTEVDEVLVGGVITGVLDNGYSLIDLNSDGQSHYARFEDINTGNRVIFELQHLAEDLITSKVIGHEANVTIGYGTRVRDFNATWKALRQEMKGGYIAKADPGIITIDADMASQYIYVMVGLIWDIEDYLSPDDPYNVLYPKLGKDIGATLHSLRKYLSGRLGDAA
jgi:hypothetical protein